MLEQLGAGPPSRPRSRVRGIPRPLEAVCLRTMQRDPSLPYASADALAEDVHAWLENRPLAAWPEGPARRLIRGVRRRGALLCGCALGLLAVAGAVSYGIRQTEQAMTWKSRAVDDHALSELLEDMHPLKAALPAARTDVELLERFLKNMSQLSWRFSTKTLVLKVGRIYRSKRLDEQKWLLKLYSEVESGMAWLSSAEAELKRQRAALSLAEGAAWEHALSEIARSPPSAGLQLEPCADLVPLGCDPQTGRWEFAHLPSGSVPVGRADGGLEVAAADGLVFVLVPPGRLTRGAEHEPGSLHTGRSGEQMALEPFFLAKRPLTREHWQRLAGPAAQPLWEPVSAARREKVLARFRAVPAQRAALAVRHPARRRRRSPGTERSSGAAAGAGAAFSLMAARERAASSTGAGPAPRRAPVRKQLMVPLRVPPAGGSSPTAFPVRVSSRGARCDRPPTTRTTSSAPPSPSPSLAQR